VILVACQTWLGEIDRCCRTERRWGALDGAIVSSPDRYTAGGVYLFRYYPDNIAGDIVPHAGEK